MTIFTTYTGNAMLNNALMTIEALAKLNNVSEVSPLILKQLYDKIALKEINKRLKSYTMVFSLNNPLVNPAKKINNAGENTYHHLLNSIIDGFEFEGERVCEISGLRFNKTFEDFYNNEIERQKKILVAESKDAKLLNKELKNIENTDTSLNRSWFPLIGGLGSDAQALPQAKFTVQIHPICIVILQFLPLSSLLYKGGILLVDSSNFELSREMVNKNTNYLAKRIESKSTKDAIENVRDFAKGDYILGVLELLIKKEDDIEDIYSDLNLWSFSNSGTGASCSIDRVPNGLIKKLLNLYINPKISNELKGILSRGDSAFSFLESLEGNKDWYLLYPNVFGSGKKKVDYSGVSPEFLEAFYQEIGKEKLIPTAKYVAGLIDKFKSKPFEKLLGSTDAWNDAEYRIELYKVLVKATENEAWSLDHQIDFLDNNDELPIKNNFYKYHKLIHYFTQKDINSTDLPKVDVSETRAFKVCKWIISLIQKDEKLNKIKSNLTNSNENQKVGFNRIILDALHENNIELEEVIAVFYDDDYNFRKYGLNELLRIYFTQKNQQVFEYKSIDIQLNNNIVLSNWVTRIQEFVNDYQTYFFANNFNPETGQPAYKKFAKTIDYIIDKDDNFYALLNEMIFNTNQHIKDIEKVKVDKWTVEELLTNPLGNNNQTICILAIKFLFKQITIKPLKVKSTNIN